MQNLNDYWNLLALKNYEFFLQYTSYGQWKTAKHLKLICSALERIERGECKRLIINISPRHGKSETTSKNFPAWYLMRNPDKELVIASYGADISVDFSRIARNKFEEWAPLLTKYKLSNDSSSAARWEVNGFRGGVAAVGIGGALTGRGADVLIIDDYCKDWQDATSETIRERTWDWYQSTARTRLSPNGAIVIVATLWTQDDLCGRLINKMKDGTGEQWEIIRIPAIAEEGDILNRQIGEVLWPERFSKEWYDDTKLAVGSQIWNSLYQCNPTPTGGAVFKRQWFQFYNILPQCQEFVISLDATFKGSDTSDYVVMQCWGRRDAEYYLMDQVRAKMDFVTTVNTFLNFCNKHSYAGRKFVEDKANGSAIINTLKSKIAGIIPINPQGSKESRAQAITPMLESKNVYFPNTSWIGDFIEECIQFPNGKHDDMVDAMSQALNNFHSGASGKVSVRRI